MNGVHNSGRTHSHSCQRDAFKCLPYLVAPVRPSLSPVGQGNLLGCIEGPGQVPAYLSRPSQLLAGHLNLPVAILGVGMLCAYLFYIYPALNFLFLNNCRLSISPQLKAKDQRFCFVPPVLTSEPSTCSNSVDAC